jgi:hypothetical protein
MFCKKCKSWIPKKGNKITLRKPKRFPCDSGVGTAYECPECHLIHWKNGPIVKRLIVNGKEWEGPVYLVEDGTITKDSIGVAAKLEGETKP